MDYLGMKLQSPDFAAFIGSSGNDISGLGKHLESWGKLLDAVAMAHPGLKLRGQTGKKRIGLQNLHHGFAKLASVAPGTTRPPKILGDELQSIADAQNGKSGFEKVRGKRWAPCPADGIRASGENNTGRAQGLYFLQLRNSKVQSRSIRTARGSCVR